MDIREMINATINDLNALTVQGVNNMALVVRSVQRLGNVLEQLSEPVEVNPNDNKAE